MQNTMEDLFTVGVVTSTHGVKGEVKVFPTTDDPRRFKKCKELLLNDKSGIKTLKVQGVKFFKQFVILKFEGIDTMDDAMLLKQKDLMVTRSNAVKCNKDEFFIADLIGLKVIDENDTEIGLVNDVIQTGANDVYEIIKEDKSTFLIPAIKECILDVDLSLGIMKIHVMDGLM